MTTAAAPAAAVDTSTSFAMTDSELEFTLIAVLLANAFLTNDYAQLGTIMKQLVASPPSPTQRADLIQKFTEALRA
ncbi:MAG: hypothetical protein ACSLFE_08270 [Gemmatimonadaceae bacterium]